MRRRLAAAALAAALAAAPGPPAAAEEDWVKMRSDSETVEVEVPPCFQPVPITNPNRVLHLLSSGLPYLSSYVKAYAHPGQTILESYLKFAIKDIGGTSAAMVEGSPGRFTMEKSGSENTVWLMLCEARIEGKCGYYVEFAAPKEVMEEYREDFERMIGSFVTRPPPEDTFSTPPGWKKVQNDFYAVLGPVNELKEPEEKKALENRLFRVSLWLDAQAPQVKLVREWTGDKRKMVARLVVHVLPTREKFQAAAGEAFREGAFAIYLPLHPERIVLVDGSPESGINEHELTGAAALQAFEARMPPLRPWVREGLRLYFEHASRRKCMPGLYPPEVLLRAKELLKKPPATFEEVLAKDEAGLRALGEAGSVACWCYLYFGLHGAEGPLKDLFRRFKEGLLGAADCQAVWDREVASYQSVTKKKFKPREVDDGAKKYFKGLKE